MKENTYETIQEMIGCTEEFLLYGNDEYVDVNNLALHAHDPHEKVTNFLRPIPTTPLTDDASVYQHIIEHDLMLLRTPSGTRSIFDAIVFFKNKIPRGSIHQYMKQSTITLSPQTPLALVRSIMMKQHANTLPVVDAKGVLLGELRVHNLLSSARFEHANRKDKYKNEKEGDFFSLPVEQFYSSTITLSPQNTITECLEMFLEHKRTTLLVTDPRGYIGVINIFDIFHTYLTPSSHFTTQFMGTETLDYDEFYSIKRFANRVMAKIAKVSRYNHLSIAFSHLGTTKDFSSVQHEFKIRLLGDGLPSIQVKSSDGTLHKNDKKWKLPYLVKHKLNSILMDLNSKK